MKKTAHNALHLTAKSVAPIVAMFLAASGLGYLGSE